MYCLKHAQGSSSGVTDAWGCTTRLGLQILVQGGCLTLFAATFIDWVHCACLSFLCIAFSRGRKTVGIYFWKKPEVYYDGLLESPFHFSETTRSQPWWISLVHFRGRRKLSPGVLPTHFRKHKSPLWHFTGASSASDYTMGECYAMGKWWTLEVHQASRAS